MYSIISTSRIKYISIVFIWLFLFLFSNFLIFGQSSDKSSLVLNVPLEYFRLELEGHMEFISPSSGDLLQKDSLELDSLGTIDNLNPDSTYLNTDIWIRIKIHNKHNQYFHNFLKITDKLNNIELYELRNNKLEKLGSTDNSRLPKDNYLLTRDKIIPLTLLPNYSHILYVKSTIVSPPEIAFQNSIYIEPSKKLFNNTLRNSGLKIFFDGLMILLSIFSLIALFSFREKIFIYFLLLIILVTQIISLEGGLIPHFIKPLSKSNFIEDGFRFPNLYFSAVILIAFLFISEQIKLSTYWRKMWKVFLSVTALIVVFGIINHIMTPVDFIRENSKINTLWFSLNIIWIIIAIISVLQGIPKKRLEAIVLFIGLVMISYTPLKHYISSFIYTFQNPSSGIKFSASYLKISAFQTDINGNILATLVVISFILILGIFKRIYELQKARLNFKIEKEISETLLYNILPESVANELKQNGESQARMIDQVTVLFTDFEEFTQKSENLTPEEIVTELNVCFIAFDEITLKYGIEKIKTIGDAYMAAGGLNKENFNEAVSTTVKAALEMNEFMLERQKYCISNNRPYFEMRVGIHTGPIVAGVVGIKKFQYDIWGDTVNTANRMESNGQIGKVNISKSSYEFLKDSPEFAFEYRGEIEVKGKGELAMYFVESNVPSENV